MMIFFRNQMDYLLRGKSNMRYIVNRILLFLMCGHVQDVNCGDDIDQEEGVGIIVSRGHQAQFISL
jgi:hypothetical protein